MLRDQMAQRPEHRRRKSARQRDLGHGTARLRTAEPRQRRERRLVERQPHCQAENDPRRKIHQKGVEQREHDTARGIEQRARDHHGAAAMAVDQRSRQRRAQAHHQQRHREAAIDQAAREAEVGGHRLAEATDQIVGGAPRDQLREAEADDGAAGNQHSAFRTASTGAVLPPAPSGRIISTVSTQRPSLKPTDGSVPTG